MIKKENTRIYITIPKALRTKLEEQAEFEGRSVSNMAAKILKDYYCSEEDSK